MRPPAELPGGLPVQPVGAPYMRRRQETIEAASVRWPRRRAPASWLLLFTPSRLIFMPSALAPSARVGGWFTGCRGTSFSVAGRDTGGLRRSWRGLQQACVLSGGSDERRGERFPSAMIVVIQRGSSLLR